MKKIFLLLTLILLCISICACSTQKPPVHYDFPEKTYQMAGQIDGHNQVTIEITNNMFEIKSRNNTFSNHGTVSDRSNEIVLEAEDGSGSVFVFDKESDNTLRFNSEKSSAYNSNHYIPDNSQFVKNY